jgi:hypothetical protein
VTCRPCEVAGYMEEMKDDYGPENTEAILALAQCWRDDCECKEES